MLPWNGNYRDSRLCLRDAQTSYGCSALQAGAAAPTEGPDRALAVTKLQDGLWLGGGWGLSPTWCWVEWFRVNNRGTAGASISVEFYKPGHWAFTQTALPPGCHTGIQREGREEGSARAWSCLRQPSHCLGVIFISLGWLSLGSSSSPKTNMLLSGPPYQWAWDVQMEFSEMWWRVGSCGGPDTAHSTSICPACSRCEGLSCSFISLFSKDFFSLENGLNWRIDI